MNKRLFEQDDDRTPFDWPHYNLRTPVFIGDHRLTPICLCVQSLTTMSCLWQMQQTECAIINVWVRFTTIFAKKEKNKQQLC